MDLHQPLGYRYRAPERPLRMAGPERPYPLDHALTRLLTDTRALNWGGLRAMQDLSPDTIWSRLTESTSTDTESAGSGDESANLAPHKRGRADRSARSLSATRQEIIHVAYKHFRLLPADDKKDDLIIEAWQVACEELGWDLEDTSLRPTEQERRLIGDRECQVRSDFKKASKVLLPARYGFKPGQKTHPDAKRIIEHNRAIVATLMKEIAFAHPLAELRTWYRTQEAPWASAGTLSLRTLLPKFSSAPAAVVAILASTLVLTTIHCAIDEWKDGLESNVPLTETPYQVQYEEYRQTLEDWDKFTMESGSRTCKKLQQDLLKICRYVFFY
ncbi:hypothetical protein OBBRIDRAFT_841473 [Obba rivulosa]|uniref:DUF6532 domain-containing protein n=1 Tax=Obba rivulosa TaxID=1052685 RepID=A0A8E2DVL4_9APHY|nr:hypothetical protein OBBRIDRAFT_841473 [Obba rivulosa]